MRALWLLTICGGLGCAPAPSVTNHAPDGGNEVGSDVTDQRHRDALSSDLCRRSFSA